MNDNRYINPDSDGKFYTAKDMVRTNCNDCKGCHACCTDMGDSIKLDPYDIWQFETKEGMSFSDLLEKGHIAITMEQAMMLPYLFMDETKKTCTFLNEEGRCSIHTNRPGICRLFPLGRDYQTEKLEYILLDKLCPANKSKIRIEKWIGITSAEAYQEFELRWHDFRKAMQGMLMEAREEEQKQMNLYLLGQFYACSYANQSETDFFEITEQKIQKVYQAFGI